MSTATAASRMPRWFNRLNAQAAAKVAMALVRLEQENLSGVKGVGAGVFDHRIDFGPGYRIYFGKDGDALIILLGRPGPKGVSGRMSKPHGATAGTTGGASERRVEDHAPDTRLQGNNPGAYRA